MEKEPTRWIIEGKKAKERNKEGERKVIMLMPNLLVNHVYANA
jgi:hypothetical protein